MQLLSPAATEPETLHPVDPSSLPSSDPAFRIHVSPIHADESTVDLGSYYAAFHDHSFFFDNLITEPDRCQIANTLPTSIEVCYSSSALAIYSGSTLLFRYYANCSIWVGDNDNIPPNQHLDLPPNFFHSSLGRRLSVSPKSITQQSNP